MKTKRFLSTLLALLLVCSLPVSAFADTVGNNPEGTTLPEISAGDTMPTNDGAVTENHGTVETNNGTVSTNSGTVEINNGVVETNNGIVETNTTIGTVKDGGTVTINYGTVQEADGTTRYGVQVLGENNNAPIQKNFGVDLDLTQFTKEGYELTGYIRNYDLQNDKVILLEGPIPVNSTSYTDDFPNVLTLIWQAINPGSGSGTGSGTGTGTSDDTNSGTGASIYISINGHQYLLVAVVEDVYCLASAESYTAEELADLPALLSSLLTEEQMTYVTGELELLDEELTAYYFGGRGSHVVFPCDKGLIFS